MFGEVSQNAAKEKESKPLAKETFGVDLRTRSIQLDAKDEGGMKTVRREVHHSQEKLRLPEEFFEGWCVGFVEDWFGPCEGVGGQASDMSPTGRLKLRQQMAAEAGKKESVSFSHFLEGNDLEVKEELPTMATLFWAAGVCMGRWRR